MLWKLTLEVCSEYEGPLIGVIYIPAERATILQSTSLNRLLMAYRLGGAPALDS
jgi:hypothetical protein